MTISINPPAGLPYSPRWIISSQRKVINPDQPVEIRTPEGINDTNLISIYDEVRTPIYRIMRSQKIKIVTGLETIRKTSAALLEYKSTIENPLVIDIIKEHKKRLNEIV